MPVTGDDAPPGLDVAGFIARVPTAHVRGSRVVFHRGTYLVHAASDDEVTHEALLYVADADNMTLSFRCLRHLVISTAEDPNQVIGRLRADAPLTCLQCLARDQ